MLNKLRNAWHTTRQVSGYNYPEMKPVIRLFLVVAALFVATGFAGCGGDSGSSLINLNPPGPWQVTVNVNFQWPQLAEGATPRRCRITLQYDNRPEEFVAEGLEGANGGTISKGIGNVRPGQHTVLVVMKRVSDGTVIDSRAPSFTVDDAGNFAPSNYIDVSF